MSSNPEFRSQEDMYPEAGYENIMPKEAVVSPESPVLKNLKTPEQAEAGKMLLERIVNDESIEEVYICGNPASGKSTIIGELTEEIQRYVPEAEIAHVYFDHHLDDLKKELEGEGGETNPPLWDDDKWDRLSQNITGDIEQKKRKADPKKRNIHLIELVGVGKKNRGTSVLAEAAAEDRDEEKKKRLFNFIIADPRILEKTRYIRDFVENEEEMMDLKSKIMDNFNCDVGEFTDSAEDGRKIKEIFSRMAPVERIFEMDKELEDQSVEWLTARDAPFNEIGDRKSRALDEVNSIQDLEGLQTEEQSNYKLRAAYFRYLARDQLGIGESEFQIAANLPLEEETLKLNLEQLLNE